MLIRAHIKPEHVDETEKAGLAVFEALDREQPQGIAYSSFRVDDDGNYVILLQIDDPASNPLPALPEFQAFQQGLRHWTSGPAVPQPVVKIGSYGTF